jgi:hypothetical protein
VINIIDPMFARTNSVKQNDYDRWERWENWAISILLRPGPTRAHPHYDKAANALNGLAIAARIYAGRYTQEDWRAWGSAEVPLRDEPPKNEPRPAAIPIEFDRQDPNVLAYAYLTAKIVSPRPFNLGQNYTQDEWLRWCCLKTIVLGRQMKRCEPHSPEWEMLRDEIMGKPGRSKRAGTPSAPSAERDPS